ncbi:hypothetical protein CRENBAI_005101 [Crenichthys baileyi]|uniref:Uncharacterized protein n=1 Tax=Crenichthys baileyi TaxID=28760 RepID=A0AAV9S1J7_9TELE
MIQNIMHKDMMVRDALQDELSGQVLLDEDDKLRTLTDSTRSLVTNMVEIHGILTGCRKLTSNEHIEDILSVQHGTSWDRDLSSILLLVHLLPPTSKGHKKSTRISSCQAVGHLVRYLQMGASVEGFLAGVEPGRRFLLSATNKQEHHGHPGVERSDKPPGQMRSYTHGSFSPPGLYVTARGAPSSASGVPRDFLGHWDSSYTMETAHDNQQPERLSDLKEIIVFPSIWRNMMLISFPLSSLLPKTPQFLQDNQARPINQG